MTFSSRIRRGVGAALLLAASGAAYADGDVVGVLGVRSLQDDLWDGLDNQVAFGVTADFGLGELPLYLATGLVVSVDDGGEGFGDATGAVADLSVGLKLMPTEGNIRPYIGAGIASVGASIDTDFGDDDDQSFGYYIGGGALFRIGGHFTLGVDVRYLGGTDIELFGFEGDADSLTATALIGYSWGD
ncbi:MAG: outer membrane beta-barrel protein [Gammaproteobacteria bacterium]